MSIERTTLVSESGGRWIDSKGRALVNMGHAPLYQGKQVWTDGVVIYGYPILGTTFTDAIAKPKTNNAGIVLEARITNDMTDMSVPMFYYKPNDGGYYIVATLQRKSPDFELLRVSKAWQYFAGGKFVFVGVEEEEDEYHRTIDYYFVADSLGNSVYMPYASDASATLHQPPELLDMNMGGATAWAVCGEGISTSHDDVEFLMVTNSDFSYAKYLNLRQIRNTVENWIKSDFPPDTDTRKTELNHIEWSGFYTHSWRSPTTDDAFVNCTFDGDGSDAVFQCDMCLSVRVNTLYTPPDADPYWVHDEFFVDIHINGERYTYQRHQNYSNVLMGCGTYNGENETMTVTYVDDEGNEHDFTASDIPPNSRAEKIGNTIYIYRRERVYANDFVYAVRNDGTMIDVLETFRETFDVNATRLEYSADVLKYGNKWSYPNSQGD